MSNGGMKITKRDLEMLKYQRELMRKAGLTAPAVQLMGPDIAVIRKFAMETYPQMRMISPGQFEGKTIDDWEKSIRSYLMTRRPEFREELMKQLRERYGGMMPSGEKPPELLASKALEELGKKKE